MTRERQSYDDKEATLAGKNGANLLAAETLRNGAESAAAAESPRGEERLSIFWRVFGGTLLSIAALVVITVYNQFSTTLTDLRKELNQLYENRAELLRKDEFTTRLNSVWAGMKELQTANQSLSYEVIEHARAKERFARAFSASPVPIAIQALADQRFVNVNDRFVSTTGYHAAEHQVVHAIDCRNPDQIIVAEIESWRVQKLLLKPLPARTSAGR